ncbi:MAG: hypothetical protein DHS20C13_03340 [Thermodesulfobacteriota bacterium]|nr:MAG: hypothetical protein DHS20C13_03340 [Thermodesulfobacteriota bacterium]
MKMVKYAFISLVALVLMGVTVQAQTLYGISHIGRDGLSTLHIINTQTGAANAVGPIGFERCGSMDFNAQGRLFAICERADGSDITVLVEINTISGAGTEIGPTDNCEAWTDMSFRNSDNTLFATGFNFDPVGPCTETMGLVQNWLTTINTQTGLSTLIAIINQVPGGGNAAAFSPTDTLYYLVGDFNTPGTNVLYTVNQLTGDVNVISNPTYPTLTDDDLPRANAMDFDQSTGVLYLSITSGGGTIMVPRQNFIGTLDINTGVVTVIGPTELGMDAIAFTPDPSEIPTLSEWGLIAMASILGIVGFMVMRRREVIA